MKLTPALAGFLKGLLIVVVLSVVSFLGDSAHLTGIMSPVLATIVASLFSSIESSMKAKSGGNIALFGAVTIK